MKRRQQKRTRAVLPVKVSVNGRTQPACTLDLAVGGVRLSGMRLESQPGHVMAVERGNRRINFRVAWVGAPGTRSAGQIGLESMEPVRGFWGVELPNTAEADEYLRAEARRDGHAAAQSDPSGSKPMLLARMLCSGEVELRKESSQSQPEKAKLREIGRRGCFVITNTKMPLNTRVQLAVKTHGKIVHVRASVRNTENAGMWLDFFDLDGDEMHTLEAILLNISNNGHSSTPQ